jgi:hypothetical protein
MLDEAKTHEDRPLKAPAKAASRLVESRPRPQSAPVLAVSGDDVEDRQSAGGVQSIGRAFAILEEVARNREGIGLAELSKRVGLHNSTTFHLVKTMVSLGYIRQLKDKR